MKWTFIAAVVAVACKGKQPEASPEPAPVPSASASAKPKGKPTVVGKPIVGKKLEVVRCNLPLDAAEGSNHVAATRHLHLGPNKTLYFFPDFKDPVRLEPTSEGCGYVYKAQPPVPKGSSLGVEPDGSFKEYANTDDAPLTKCKTSAFSNLRYGHGRVSGGTFIYKKFEELMSMDLNDPKCAEKKLEPNDVPKELGNKANVSLAGDQFLLGYARQDWKYSREIFRFDKDLTLVRKYGAAEGKGEIQSGDFFGCGDGLCAFRWMSHVAVYDREGMEVSTTNMHDLLKIERFYLSAIVDVPDKGVYMLVGHIPEKGGKGRAELVRLDGVY